MSQEQLVMQDAELEFDEELEVQEEEEVQEVAAEAEETISDELMAPELNKVMDATQLYLGRRLPPAHGRRGSLLRPSCPARRQSRAQAHDRIQPAPGGQDCPALQQPRPGAAGSYRRGQPRSHPGGREV